MAVKQTKPKVTKTADSTAYFTSNMLSNIRTADMTSGDTSKSFSSNAERDAQSISRQKNKGRVGYDKNGYPLKNKK